MFWWMKMCGGGWMVQFFLIIVIMGGFCWDRGSCFLSTSSWRREYYSANWSGARTLLIHFNERLGEMRDTCHMCGGTKNYKAIVMNMLHLIRCWLRWYTRERTEDDVLYILQLMVYGFFSYSFFCQLWFLKLYRR